MTPTNPVPPFIINTLLVLLSTGMSWVFSRRTARLKRMTRLEAQIAKLEQEVKELKSKGPTLEKNNGPQ